MAGLGPRWGNDPSQPGQGAVWATQGSVWQKEKKTAQPGKQPPAQTKNTPALGFPSGTRVPQKPAVVRGVKKEQVKGPGSLEASRAGSLRPAEPVVEGFFQGVNFPIFRGRFWGLGVKLGVVNAGFFQCRAILYGVKIGAVTVSCLQQGKQSARLCEITNGLNL